MLVQKDRQRVGQEWHSGVLEFGNELGEVTRAAGVEFMVSSAERHAIVHVKARGSERAWDYVRGIQEVIGSAVGNDAGVVIAFEDKRSPFEII